MSTTTRPSPFFYANATAESDSLAILHLKRDSLLPITLGKTTEDGYAEGAVTNTRFGSFPHSTLVGLDWGSQVRASKVDTGTRGRKKQKAKQEDASAAAAQAEEEQEVVCDPSRRKRKSTGEELPESPTKKFKPNPKEKEKGQSAAQAQVGRAAVEAGSGFVHILPPTPESWTSSLDHRTQVVYTPDNSYILQRLRVRPGSSMIEAGAGSGSFTHASARAVFSGYPDNTFGPPTKRRKTGKVYSFEYHEPRVQTLREEITEHQLDGVVQLTHRDVCNDGFVLQDGSAPSVDAIFLDLPAPWQALKHLSRATPNTPLNPNSPVHICTFSPCIEQVMATVTELRKSGWADISMVEVQHKRIDIRRERVGLKEEGLRGVNASAANVEEALGRLREVETKISDFHANRTNSANREEVGQQMKTQSKQQRLEKIKKDAEERMLYKEGHLVHRTEPEVKTHTSYLVFAILPREWSEEDEKKCEELYPVDEIMKGSPVKEGKAKK
ncbi:tRNA (adenine(58)-N(1))-methyltransferase catalytic subunit trm61 [Fulvia fulva]|uniref:tRNA (adenine(58)-N(1))-methyltransferase catalytic subunit TRM61 n=1 Tax=Passalora fulva TaxID=5499 RepID=A0A9Q8LEH7_PASFU|nr:tRNA (adenine(58)-N(1))-methyltransferase catalytic subunit trm61 [Fulvia fulva]UJO15912.1 tRNA (adenine(58)-N(1))-methyltransferase catalytic subunit trm61 [Fulvia fulva]